jgi:hypothetical protein
MDMSLEDQLWNIIVESFMGSDNRRKNIEERIREIGNEELRKYLLPTLLQLLASGRIEMSESNKKILENSPSESQIYDILVDCQWQNRRSSRVCC